MNWKSHFALILPVGGTPPAQRKKKKKIKKIKNPFITATRAPHTFFCLIVPSKVSSVQFGSFERTTPHPQSCKPSNPLLQSTSSSIFLHFYTPQTPTPINFPLLPPKINWPPIKTLRKHPDKMVAVPVLFLREGGDEDFFFFFFFKASCKCAAFAAVQ